MSPYDGAGQPGRQGGGDRDGRDGRARRRARGRQRDAAPESRREGPRPGPAQTFLLYVEGARDHDLVRTWAHRLSPRLARSLEPCAVILGGRRPARAVEHFREMGGAEAGARGLVVLDRDHHDEGDMPALGEPGLELFTWGRRHIESYVLVPDAIRRVLLRRDVDRGWLDRLIEDHLPAPDDEAAHRSVNAKHLLGSKGPLAQQLGQALTPGEIARCMRAEELHQDVITLYERIRANLGLAEPTFEVVRRPPSL